MSSGRSGITVAALTALLALAPQVAAQDASTLKKDMIGQWELATTERSKTCVVTMKGDTTPQGFKLELEPGCAAALPFTKEITAWNIKGLDIVRMQDAAGQPVIDFTEVESGIFEGLRTGEGVYILQNLAAARSLAKSMDQMIGDWSMVRGNGQTICGLTLTNTEATGDNFQVFLKPKCDPAVAAWLASDLPATRAYRAAKFGDREWVNVECCSEATDYGKVRRRATGLNQIDRARSDAGQPRQLADAHHAIKIGRAHV